MIVIIFLSILSGLNAEIKDCDPEIKVIYDRMDWRAATNVSKAKAVVNPYLNVNFVVIHHTATNSCSSLDECSEIIKKIEKFDMEDMGKSDVLMNFYIGGEGLVFKGRGWAVEDEDLPGYPFAFNVGFIGNFTEEVPSHKLLFTGLKLLQCSVKQRRLAKTYKVYGHRDFRCTDCPGEKLYNAIKKWPAFSQDSNISNDCPSTRNKTDVKSANRSKH